jgi:TPP-dependent pyruvate/acetoin dehydrogenase alpha subunit
MRLKMKMPDLAATESEISITRWIVAPGQRVERGQPLLEVETDKATMQVESVATGILVEVLSPANESVAVGQIIAVLEVGERGAAARTADEPTSPDRELLLQLYERMVLIREFEEGIKFLFLEGIMPGTIHQCQGQEATAVGVCAALRPDDFITSTFRGHGHALAKGLSVQELLDELFGAASGCCRGKGGSMHVGNMAKGMIPGIAIVAGGIPVAAGMALAFKMQRTDRVVACFFGDGAVAEGAFHEGVNMAAIWNLPVVFVCENNLYGASTHVSKVMRDTNIAGRVGSYGIRGQRVDGNDVLAVYEAARTAVQECRTGRGPVLLELLTYRRTGHSRRDPCRYQPKEEREAWIAQDPIERLAALLKSRAIASDTELEAIKTEILRRFDAAVEVAKRQPLPTLPDLTTEVFA